MCFKLPSNHNLWQLEKVRATASVATRLTHELNASLEATLAVRLVAVAGSSLALIHAFL